MEDKDTNKTYSLQDRNTCSSLWGKKGETGQVFKNHSIFQKCYRSSTSEGQKLSQVFSKLYGTEVVSMVSQWDIIVQLFEKKSQDLSNYRSAYTDRNHWQISAMTRKGFWLIKKLKNLQEEKIIKLTGVFWQCCKLRQQ